MPDRRTLDVTLTSPTSPPKRLSVVLAHVVHWSLVIPPETASKGVDAVARLDVHLSNGEILAFEAEDAMAYHAALRRAFERELEAGVMAPVG